MFVRAYTEAAEAPVTLELREDQEILVERRDYDLERTADRGMDMDG